MIEQNENAENYTPLTTDVGVNTPTLKESDEVIEMSDNFNFDDFQVVRREFFAHLKEPSVSFNECKFYVNAACLSKFPNCNYAQVLVNREKRILALRPCEEEVRDSFMWCTEVSGKKKIKSITCKIFFAKIVSLMDWNPKYRYKLLGKIVHSKDDYLIAFDLTSTEVYQKTVTDDNKPKVSRTPVFPAEWKNQFGLTVSEHRHSLQINVFDGYAIYAIKDETNTQATKTNETEHSKELLPVPEINQGE